MAGAVSWYSVSVADNTVNPKNGEPETANWQVPITTITPANLAQTVTLTGNLLAAVQAIILGVQYQKVIVADRTVNAKTPAASQAAQRENKFLLRYHDIVTGKKYNVSFPTADLTKLPNHQELLDLTAGVGLALVEAFQDLCVSPDDAANGVLVDSVQFVGRNL